jgi:hypothetical protein
MLVKLWVFTSQNKPEGLLTNMDASDISDVMEFKGNPRVLIHALLDCSTGADAMKSCPGCDVCEKAKTKKRAAWLDKTSSGFYRVHDWEEHNPYACKAPLRISIAKKGATARWEKKSKQAHAPCYEQETAMLKSQQGNAPAPAPAPVPVPSPIERGGEPNRSITAPRRFDAIAFEKAETAWKEFSDVLLKSPDKIVINDPISRKIYFDIGPDRIIELHSQNGGQLQQEFITRYSVIEVASFKAKV